MVLKANTEKRVYKWLFIIILALVLPIHITVNGVPFYIINLFVSICIVETFSFKKGSIILKRAYEYKSEWFEVPNMKIIETGKITRNVAFAIGKAVNKESTNQNIYTVIFSKGRKKLTEYNRSFEGSTLVEVSDYLDYVAENF